jgi:excisionase family DNA binding protein
MTKIKDQRAKQHGTPRLPIPKQLVRHGDASHAPARAIAENPPETKQQIPVDTPHMGSCSSPERVLDLRKEKTITVKDAAYRAMKSEDTIYRWLRSGRIKGWQPGGARCNVLISETSLQDVMNRSTVFVGR